MDGWMDGWMDGQVGWSADLFIYLFIYLLIDSRQEFFIGKCFRYLRGINGV